MYLLESLESNLILKEQTHTGECGSYRNQVVVGLFIGGIEEVSTSFPGLLFFPSCSKRDPGNKIGSLLGDWWKIQCILIKQVYHFTIQALVVQNCG